MALSLTSKLLRNAAASTNRVQLPATKLLNGNLMNNELFECGKCDPVFVIQRVSFHHQNVIQIHIQSSHGILFDALQRSRVHVDELNLKVPDELRRLKAGSLKWLFDVWPFPKKSLSEFSQVRTLLQVQDLEVRKALRKNHRTASEEQLHEVLDFLRGKRVAVRRLVRLPWLLTSNPVTLEEAVRRVRRYLHIQSFHVAISFVNLSELKLHEAAVVWRNDAKELSEEFKRISEEDNEEDVPAFRNRIDLVAYYMKCPEEDVADMMAKVYKLMIIPISQIKSTLTCLLDGGVRPEAIISDPYVFVNNLNTMRNRIRILNENGITLFKPWVLRSPLRIFEVFMAREMAEIQLLGSHKDIRGFLREKLNCDEKMTANLLAKVPNIKTASATKLNEMIEFLLSEKYTTAHILDTPRVLGHSVETISQRMTEVSAYVPPLVSLHMLCRTSKDYRAILRKLKKDAITVSKAAKSSQNEKKSPTPGTDDSHSDS